MAVCPFFSRLLGCEREVAEAATEEQRNDSLMRLSWALVHSKNQDDVNLGLGMLEGHDKQVDAVDGSVHSTQCNSSTKITTDMQENVVDELDAGTDSSYRRMSE
ncbi:hypothetical protein ABZP36_023513 [Zizania latifolia]